MVQARVAPEPGWVAMASVMEAFEFVTTLPDWSSTLTEGWVPQASPSVPPLGVLTTSWEAVPKVMETLLEVIVVKPVAAAVTV